jgi:hypothetical protein
LKSSSIMDFRFQEQYYSWWKSNLLTYVPSYIGGLRNMYVHLLPWIIPIDFLNLQLKQSNIINKIQYLTSLS